MPLSKSDAAFLAMICLIGAAYACGKSVETLCACFVQFYEQFIIVDRRAAQIGSHWHIKIYYRHGVGHESVIDERRCVVSTRSFRWERSLHGEIHEVEQ